MILKTSQDLQEGSFGISMGILAFLFLSTLCSYSNREPMQLTSSLDPLKLYSALTFAPAHKGVIVGHLCL
jgi:hypothetical protein